MLTSEWATAIEGFLAHERAGGKRKATNDQRRHHLHHLARRVTVGPWRVTADVLFDYFAAQEWATETRRGRRTSLERFYSWGEYRGFVQNMLGHATPTTTRRYVDYGLDGARAALDVLAS